MRRGKVKSDDVIKVIWILSTSAAAQMVFHHAVQEARFAHVAGLKNSRPFRYLLKNWPLPCPTNIINERSSSSLQGIGFENDMGWTCHQFCFWSVRWAFLTDQKQIRWHVRQIFLTDQSKKYIQELKIWAFGPSRLTDGHLTDVFFSTRNALTLPKNLHKKMSV